MEECRRHNHRFPNVNYLIRQFVRGLKIELLRAKDEGNAHTMKRRQYIAVPFLLACLSVSTQWCRSAEDSKVSPFRDCPDNPIVVKTNELSPKLLCEDFCYWHP